MRTYAQVELGQPLPPVSKETIEKADADYRPIEVLHLKILGNVCRDNPDIQSIMCSGIGEAVNGLSEYLQISYRTHLFNGMLGVGDIDTAFSYYSDFGNNKLVQFLIKLKVGYRMID